MTNHTNRFKKIYDNKIFWIVVSLLASIAIWMYVTSIDSDEYTRVFKGVLVEFVGEDTLRENKNMVITDQDTNTVTVEVRGPRRIVTSMSPDDLTAVIDVSKLSKSAYTSLQYSVVFPNSVDTSKLTTVSRSPDTVNFMVSELTTKTINVRGSFEGSTAAGYTGKTPTFEPATITITGAETYLRDIESAYVAFGAGVTELTSSYSVETGFVLKDKNNNDCSTKGISFSDETVVANLTILQIKDVALGVNLVYGAVPESNVIVDIQPSTITLVGDSAILDTYNKIILKTIDLSDFATSYTDTFPITIDNDVTNQTGVTEATVTVEIVGLDTKSITVSNFSCSNVTEGFVADILTKTLSVVLRGPAEELKLIDSDNIRATADLTDYNETAGVYMVEVKFNIDAAGVQNVGVVGDYTISIELKKD